MLVYRDAERVADSAAETARLDRTLAQLARAGDRDLATEALIEAGALEAAAVDAANPQRDGFGPAEAAWRAVALETARVFRGSRRGEAARTRAAAERAREALARAARHAPAKLTVKTPEGYAWYALYPETYHAAAEQFLASSAELPAVVIGLRGIGASLSAVVAAALEAAGREVESLTLRPRGDPFDRTVALTPELEARLRRRAGAGAWFLIVDEGPGLSGSSFCGVAEALSRLGAGDEQIVFFPSGECDGAGLRSESARRRWPRHRRVRIGFEAMRDDLAPGLASGRDLSGGLWRDLVCGRAARPPVAPQHERRKYLSEDGAVLAKYAGLGRTGRGRLARSEALAEAGFAPEPKSFADGFLATEFVRGRPLRRREREAEVMRRAAAYVGWLGRNAATGAAVQGDELFPMLTRNVELALGEAGLGRLGALEAWRGRLAGAPAVAVDGRMAAHEWVRADERLLKTDAVDHHDDHFLPGATDPAWDVAGFSVEWGLSPAEAADFADEAAREAGDATLASRLPFYEAAYLAFRTGWTSLAASSMPDGPDRRGLRRQERRYRGRLAQALGRMEADT